MPLKQASITVAAAAALFVAMGSVSVSAQESCGNLYNRVMWNYQTHGAQSQEYARISDYYSRRCLAGSSSAPVSAYPYQTPYAYQQPVDPGAALLGAVVGGVVGDARDGDHRRRYDDDRGRRGW
jgi:hypothetical protein